MSGFIIKKILTEKNLGERLRIMRTEKKISLQKLSTAIFVSARHLDALERGAFDELPDDFYVKNFIKRYAAFFGQPAAQFLHLLEKERADFKKSESGLAHFRPIVRKYELMVMPRLIKISLACFAVLALLGYLGAQIKIATTPPPLLIIAPQDGLLTHEPRLQIKGKTAKESRLMINGETALVDARGNFNEIIDLRRGSNIITVSASKRHSKEQTVYRRVVFEEKGLSYK